MSEHQHMEHLSCLVDGELNGSEGRFLLKRLSHDDELSSRWRRYHFYGDIMRSEQRVFRDNLVDRVRTALESEPAHQRAGTRSWIKPAAGVAVAATVAIAAFNALYVAPAPQPAIDDAPVAESSFNGGPSLPQQASVASGTAAGSRDASRETRLQSYVLRHNEASVRRGQGLVPYIYMVSAPEKPEVDDAADDQSVAE